MFFDRFKQLCTEKGVSTTSVVEAVGMNRSAVTYWKKSGATPKADIVKKIADHLGVSAEALLLEPDQKLDMLLAMEPAEAYAQLETMAEAAGTDLAHVANTAGVRSGEVDLLKRNRKASAQAITLLYNTLTADKAQPMGADAAYIHDLLATLTEEETRRVASFLRLMFPDKP